MIAFSGGAVLPRIYMEMEEKLLADSMLRWGFTLAFVGKSLFMVTIFYTYQKQTEDIAILNVKNSEIRTVLAVCIVVDKLVTIPIFVYANKCELHAFVQSKVRTKFEQNRLSRCTVNIMECVTILIPSVLFTKFVPNCTFGTRFVPNHIFITKFIPHCTYGKPSHWKLCEHGPIDLFVLNVWSRTIPD